jgi:protein-S-isoprenylcysteine O-methyltransferase Ste14
MLSSTEAAWMLSYEVMGGPLADPAVWRGALLWAIALYVPLSAPLSTLESSLEESELPEAVRQPALVISSLLLAMVTGVVTQLGLSWALGPGWASSIGVVAVGWSVLLILANAGKDD